MQQANSVEEYLNFLQRYETQLEVFYRGQLEKFSTTPPSIARDDGYKQNEAELCSEAIRLGKEDFSSLTNPLVQLSKLQHYGVPTRLVDVTVDSLVALYFAIEDTEDNSDALISLYIQQGHDFSSKAAQLLALFATLNDRSQQNMAFKYKQLTGNTLSEEEIVAYTSKPIFVRHCEELRKTNPRLHNQAGAFLICCEDTDGNFLSLDVIKPNATIRIPFEYKAKIKEDLDSKYNINNLTIYPELTSVATYIKSKYKASNFSPDGKYTVISSKDSSTGFARRVSVEAVLNAVLDIDQIQVVAKTIIDEYRNTNEVVWAFVAKAGEDFVVNNWILKGQWISPTLEEKYAPNSLRNTAGDGYSWDYASSYSTMKDFYNEHIFEDDKTLLAYHEQLFHDFVPLYYELKNAFDSQSYGVFAEIITKNQEIVSDLYLVSQDLGKSKNREFDDYLFEFGYALTELDNLKHWMNNKKINERARQYGMTGCMRRADLHIGKIMLGLITWKRTIGFTEEDYGDLDYRIRKKREFQYEQTIPVKKDALVVDFSAQHTVDANGAIVVKGTTNIFDGAKIMLSFKGASNEIVRSAKTKVTNGSFCFDSLSNNDQHFPKGKYSVEITVSIPSVQTKEFTAQAGLQYENLTGELVSRKGIGPTVNYCMDIFV